MSQNADNTAKKLPGKPFGRGFDNRRNLQGRPRGSKNYDMIFDEAIKKIVKQKNLIESPELEIVMRGIAEARAGNFNFYKDILDRRYGKAKEFLELAGEVEQKDNKVLDLLNNADKETRKKFIDAIIAMLRKRVP
jgi:hypothetical protein